MLEKIDDNPEDLVFILLEAVPADRGRVDVAAGFNFRGLGFENVVELVAVLGGRSAGAPGVAVELDQPGLGGGFVARAALHFDKAADEWQLMVFGKEDDGAVLKLNALGLSGMKRRKRRNGNRLPGLRL